MKQRFGSGLNPDIFGVTPVAQVTDAAGRGRRDGRIDRKVAMTKGAYKGLSGVVKSVIGTEARVELHTNSKVITVLLSGIKEQKYVLSFLFW